VHLLGEVGDHRGIDCIGLGQPADGAGELAYLARVDDRHRQSRLAQSGRHDTLVAAAGFQDHKPRPQWRQPPDQGSQAIGAGRAMERGAVGSDMHVDPRLGNIDADKAVGLELTRFRGHFST